MEILDRLSEGAERVAREAEKVFGQGKRKVEEFQTERQMDTVARRLGYLEYETHRGRIADPAKREELLAELAKLEEEQKEREAAREAEAAAEASSPEKATGEMAEVERVQQAAAAAGTAPNPVTGQAPASGAAAMPGETASAGGEGAQVESAEEQERRMYGED